MSHAAKAILLKGRPRNLIVLSKLMPARNRPVRSELDLAARAIRSCPAHAL